MTEVTKAPKRAKKQSAKVIELGTNLKRHRARCIICAHPKVDEICNKWANAWVSLASLFEEYGEGCSYDSFRHSVKDHCKAFKIKRNANPVLERVVEIGMKALSQKPNISPQLMVRAAVELAKLQGEKVPENVDSLDRMSKDELLKELEREIGKQKEG